MNMIAIGGAIGTGLFVASGATIADAGPGGALVAYGAIGLMVFLLMQSLGEMATYSPVSGAFAHYARTYVSPSFGFATGWNYWFNWAITVAAELVAAALVMKFWFPSTPGWVWSAIFLALLFSLNIASVKGYGEGEFWFALIKVVAVIVFLGIGVLMIAGILGGKSPGFSNWTHGEAPFKAGFLGILNVFMIAGFSFQGTELVGVAAGESRNPDKDIPRAIRSVFIRIMLFYIGAIAVIGFLIQCNQVFSRQPQPPSVRRRQYFGFTLHLGVPKCGCSCRCDHHERGHLDLDFVGGKLRPVRVDTNAVCDGEGWGRTAHLRKNIETRCAPAGTLCHHGGGIAVFPHLVDWGRRSIRVAG